MSAEASGSGAAYAGGIAGNAYRMSCSLLANVSSNLNISASSSSGSAYTGGIVGYRNSSSSVIDANANMSGTTKDIGNA